MESVRSVRVMGNWAGASVFVLMLTVLVITGCGGSSSNNTNITSISITPTAVTVGINTQVDFTATVTLANSTISTNTAVTWQVNGTTGGNSTTGTIASSSTDVNVGIYTAPGVVPSTNNGQVTITAIITSSTSSSSTSSTTITSNSATVTIGVGTGLAVSPRTATVPAGGNYQFTATLNSVTDTGAQWTVSSSNGGDIGSINSTTGLYTAPNAPPPGGSVTITATDSRASGPAQATANIVFSDASLKGPFAFSYTGDDSSGFRAVAGRFVADGAGTIESGVEDIDSFATLATSAVPILSGSYKVGADGRSTATVSTSHGTETWQFVLTSTQHALLIRFDTSTTGSGTIDQQNLDDLTSSLAVITGPYVFLATGGDAQFNPLGIAGRFSANGAGGISSSGTVVDQNDNGTVTSSTLSGGSYSFDTTVNSGTGRGVLTLSSSGSPTQLQFAFYVIDNTHLYIVEADQVDYLAGSVYSEPNASSYATSTFPAGTFAFTAGGNSSAGAYASGGVFVSDGNGNITSGAFDSDNAGTAANTSLGACTYSVGAATGRIDLKLCPSGGSNLEYVAYESTVGTLLMLEVDSTAVASGTAYVQQGTPASLSGNFALALSGQGIFHAAPGSYQSDAEGQEALGTACTSSSPGNLDINNYGAVYPSDPLGATSCAFGTPGTNGRQTATLAPTDPPATYSLVYYWVSPNTALLVGQDKTRVLTGIVILQY